jgi:hypothetical protein
VNRSGAPVDSKVESNECVSLMGVYKSIGENRSECLPSREWGTTNFVIFNESKVLAGGIRWVNTKECARMRKPSESGTQAESRCGPNE